MTYAKEAVEYQHGHALGQHQPRVYHSENAWPFRLCRTSYIVHDSCNFYCKPLLVPTAVLGANCGAPYAALPVPAARNLNSIRRHGLPPRRCSSLLTTHVPVHFVAHKSSRPGLARGILSHTDLEYNSDRSSEYSTAQTRENRVRSEGSIGRCTNFKLQSSLRARCSHKSFAVPSAAALDLGITFII